ncbi:hypothetical protein BRC96_05360 [Halobacteriales archaeon QS_6_64_34]|nr:MAG: hypothetical protein BRC96_05360 [Halobacteriales archaeon QS_6_64_34]
MLASALVVSGAGTTEVRLSPAEDSVDPGATVEYEVVVAEASGGVGSFNATVSVNDSSVATIESVTYADSPAYASQPEGGDSVRLAATGMDTLQSGPVELATVTVRAENPGTVGLSVRVAALGDENGSSYSVTGTDGRVLTVEGQTDDGNTGGNDGTDDDSGDDSEDDGDGTPTATPTETATTSTETAAASETPDDVSTQSPSTTVTTTDATATEPGSLYLVPLVVIGSLIVVITGLIYYQRE